MEVPKSERKVQGVKIEVSQLEAMTKLTKNTVFIEEGTGKRMASVRFRAIPKKLAADLAERNAAIVNGGAKRMKRSKEKEERGLMAACGNRWCRNDVSVGR